MLVLSSIQFPPRILSIPGDFDPPKENINVIAFDSQMRIWAGTDLGLSVYEHGKWQRLFPGNKLARPIEGVEHIVTGNKNIMWVGSWQKGKNGGLRQFRAGVELPFKKSDMPNSVDAITISTSGYLWVASGERLLAYNGEKWNDIIRSPDPTAIIQTLLVDNIKRLWCGTGSGLYYYENNSWCQLKELEGLAINVLIKKDKTDHLWVGTSKGLYVIAEGVTKKQWDTEFSSNEIFALCFSNEADLWIGTSDGLTRLRHGKFDSWNTFNSGLVNQCIHALAVDNTKNILWIGTKNGISQFNLSVDKEL